MVSLGSHAVMCRSGRTGRAGKTGVCVTLVGRNKEGLIPFIEKKAGVKFERTGAPQPADMAKVAGAAALLSPVLLRTLDVCRQNQTP